MPMLFRIGHGYDVHALAEGLPLVLGGVGIEPVSYTHLTLPTSCKV